MPSQLTEKSLSMWSWIVSLRNYIIFLLTNITYLLYKKICLLDECKWKISVHFLLFTYLSFSSKLINCGVGFLRINFKSDTTIVSFWSLAWYFISTSIRIIAGKMPFSYLLHRNILFSFILYEEYKENSCTLICLILVTINTSLWIGKRCHVNVNYVNAW